MTRQMSYLSILNLAIDIGAIPATADVTRKGEARWVRDELRILAWISKSAGKQLEWFVNIGDLKLGSLLPNYGGVEVRVRSRKVLPIQWPQSITAQLEEFLKAGIGAGSSVVSDREDLCRLLAERDEVERDEMYFWQGFTNFPSRLVKALILARDLKNIELEREALMKLKSLRGVAVPVGFPGDMLDLAKDWAKRYAREMKIDIIF